MKKRRAEREAAKAAKEAMDEQAEAERRRGRGRRADKAKRKKAKAKASKADTATRGVKRAKAGRTKG